jgi:cell wall-associated NlpC family hydrolase
MKPVALLSLLSLLLVPAAQAAPPSEDIPMLAISLVGSPYQYGGTSPETGLDCSGFVGYVFRQAAGVTLPRDSLSISESAQPVEPAELQPGDLVFFDTSNRAFSHVGIYLGDDRFVHASSSRTGSVVISNLHDHYWRDRFDGARRVVSADGSAQVDDVF